LLLLKLVAPVPPIFLVLPQAYPYPVVPAKAGTQLVNGCKAPVLSAFGAGHNLDSSFRWNDVPGFLFCRQHLRWVKWPGKQFA
jgi:hypothetical protein